MKTKKTSRFLVALFLCLTFMLALIPLTVTTLAAEDAHTHCICGDVACAGDTAGEGHKSATFEPLPATGVTADEEKYYYLAEDITLTGNITVNAGGSLYLDLNGHVLKGSGTGSVITNNGTFTLCDCNGDSLTHRFAPAASANSWELLADGAPAKADEKTVNGGGIMGGNAENGGGVYNAGTFTMYGGTIFGNYASSYGGGVYNKSKFTMTGGAIRDNLAGVEGGGMYNARTSGTGNAYFSGNVRIVDNSKNKDSVLSASNFAAEWSTNYSETAHIALIGALGSNAEIGFTPHGNVNPTMGMYVVVNDSSISYRPTLADANKFVGDDPGVYFQMHVVLPAVMAYPHSHKWTYEADGNTITAKCSGSDCEYNVQGVSLTLTNQQKEYTGTPVAYVPDATFASVTKKTVTVKYQGAGDAEPTTTAPTNVGVYTVSVTIDDKTVTAQFEITKINIKNPTAPTNVSNLTYNGTAQALVNAGSAAGGTMQYKLGENGSWSNDIPSATNAGDYKVYWMVKGDGDHNDYNNDDFVTVTIAKKKVTVSGIGANEKTYDGNTTAVLNYTNVAFEGIVNGDTLSVIAQGEFIDLNVESEIRVNISNLVLSGEDEANYELNATGQQDHTTSAILKKNITVTADDKSKAYGEKDGEFTYTSDGLVDGDTLVDIIASCLGHDENVGTYEIEINQLAGANANYNITFTTGTLTITPKDITVTANGITKIYGETDGELTYAADGLVGEDQLIGITVSRVSGEDVGTYVITPTQPAGANPNYHITFANGSFIIRPKSIEGLTVEVELGKPLTENGSEQTQTVKKVTVNGVEVGYEVLGNKGTAAGNYTMQITVIGNYTGTVDQKFIILTKELPIDTDNTEDGKTVISVGEGTISIGGSKEQTPAEGNTESEKEVSGSLSGNSNDIISSVLNADDLVRIAAGEKVEVWVDVTAGSDVEVSNEVKAAMEEAIKSLESNYAIAAYLDISLFKQFASDASASSLHNLNAPVTVSLEIDKDLIGNGKGKCVIIRSHEGQVKVLPAEYDEETGIITFETDRFSDYAVAMEEEKSSNGWIVFLIIIGSIAVLAGIFVLVWIFVMKRPFSELVTIIKNALLAFFAIMKNFFIKVFAGAKSLFAKFVGLFKKK